MAIGDTWHFNYSSNSSSCSSGSLFIVVDLILIDHDIESSA
jgi:hypothetical protein